MGFMPRLRTLSARFGTLYASIILIVAGVCAVFIVQLAYMRTDSGRVMEETREQVVLMRAICGTNTLKGLFADPEHVSDFEIEEARSLLQKSVLELDALDDHPGDPSRKEHQDAEQRLSDRLRHDLDQLDQVLNGTPDARMLERALALVYSAAHDADVLQEEAQEEAQEALLDLEERAQSLRYIIVATLFAASLLLGTAMMFVQWGVTRPLRVLRSGAERFGRGEFGHRIRVENSDEIGDLASSLNQMADELADAKEHLEERVRVRTSEFLRAARLADLGVLASGIAHEINTPLASIASCIEGLQRRKADDKLSDELLEDYSETIRREVYRARGITTRMLALVRQEPGKLSDISLQIILEQSLSALAHRAQVRRVQLESSVPDDDVFIKVNGGELVQIIVNLLANAVDASPAGSTVTLRARVAGDQLTLTVEDQGSGIREEDLEKIFEPFFTTKAPGEGTGLGLALVSTMVEAHRGRVTVRSEVGVETSIEVTLPTNWSLDQ